MKTFAQKLIAATFIIALATGCASVTDAGLDRQPEQTAVEQPAPQPENPGFGTDSDMHPIVDRPE